MRQTGLLDRTSRRASAVGLLDRANGLLAEIGDLTPARFDCRDADDLGMQLMRASQSMAAQALRLVGESQANGYALFAGYNNNTRHLAVGADMSNGEAKACVDLAAFITTHPLIAEAISDGGLSLSRVKVLLDAADKKHNAFTRDLPELLSATAGMSFEQFCEHIQRWMFNSPNDDPSEPTDSETSHSNRSVKINKRLDGSSSGSFEFDAHGTVMLEEFLDTVPPDPTDAPVTRTREQKDADTLIEAVELFLNGGDNGPPKRVINTVLDLGFLSGDRGVTGWGRMMNLGNLIPNDLLDQLSCDASRRIIIRNGHEVLSVGDAAADLTSKQRDAIKTRDRRCQFTACDRGPSWCQIHHLKPRNKGGGNEPENLILLCGHHHRLIHATRWTITKNTKTGIVTTFWDGPNPEHLTPEDLNQYKQQFHRATNKHKH